MSGWGEYWRGMSDRVKFWAPVDLVKLRGTIRAAALAQADQLQILKELETDIVFHCDMLYYIAIYGTVG